MLVLFKQRKNNVGLNGQGSRVSKGSKKSLSSSDSSVLGARDENTAAKSTTDTERRTRKVRFGGLQEGESEAADSSPSKSPIRTRGNALSTRGGASHKSRYRLQPSTPHNAGSRTSSSSSSSSKRRAESLVASATTTEGVKKRGGLLAKMKSLGGLKAGAARTGSTKSIRSKSSAIGAGASRPGSSSGGGRWN